LAEPLLSIDGVCARYGSVQVLFDVSLRLDRGDLLLLAGPNGAGKTTLMRVLVGLHTPSKGEIRLDGEKINSLAPHSRARLGVAWISEGRGIIPELSVEENLDLARFTKGWKADRRDRSFDRFPVLSRSLKRAAGTLSGGEQQMLSLARALETAPRLLLVDEPSRGLAPKIVTEVMDTLRTLREEGQSILLVEQRAAQVQHVATRVLLMRHGTVNAAPETLEFTEMNFADFVGANLDERVT
jgi:branched-chain amino acid transport system ATP-binding protein